MSKSRSYVFKIKDYIPEDVNVLEAIECRYMVYHKWDELDLAKDIRGFMQFENQRYHNAVSKMLPRAEVKRCFTVGESIWRIKGKDMVPFVEKGREPQPIGGDPMCKQVVLNKRLMQRPLRELLHTGEVSRRNLAALRRIRDDYGIFDDLEDIELDEYK
jgi:hypothetical protein